MGWIFTLLTCTLLCVGVHSLAQLLNKCSFTVWPGLMGKTYHPNNGGLELGSGKAKDIFVPAGWIGQIWARTDCLKNMTCGTGFCGNSIECQGNGPSGPATSAFFQFNRAGSDYYYVSFLQGHNVPLTIKPVGSKVASNCTAAGECAKGMNQDCPLALKHWYRGNIVGCKSACQKFQDDRYCCTGGSDNMFECNDRSWPCNYPRWFKTNCPKSLTYKYDSENSPIYSCSGSVVDTVYLIRFC